MKPEYQMKIYVNTDIIWNGKSSHDMRAIKINFILNKN